MSQKFNLHMVYKELNPQKKKKRWPEKMSWEAQKDWKFESKMG